MNPIPKMKPATKADFDAFVAAYPRKTERAVLTICEPEILQINDFSLGNWPASVVAQYQLWGCDPTDIYAQVPGNWKVLNEVLS